MEIQSVTIHYKSADEKRIYLEVSIEVKELLEQSDRQIRSQRRQERRHHTEYVEGLTDTATVLPQEDIADLLHRLECYKRLYTAIERLTEKQRRRVILHYFKGLSCRQIARYEGVTHVTIVHSIGQARKALGKHLSK